MSPSMAMVRAPEAPGALSQPALGRGSRVVVPPPEPPVPPVTPPPDPPPPVPPIPPVPLVEPPVAPPWVPPLVSTGPCVEEQATSNKKAGSAALGRISLERFTAVQSHFVDSPGKGSVHDPTRLRGLEPSGGKSSVRLELFVAGPSEHVVDPEARRREARRLRCVAGVLEVGVEGEQVGRVETDQRVAEDAVADS